MSVTLWTEPKVTLIGVTEPYTIEYYRGVGDIGEGDLHAHDARSVELLPIFAGRACYQSFGDKAGRRSAEEYLGHILEVKHHSVLEHSSVTFYIEGVSRALTHELIRHRHLSYSQLSQRYVDHSEEIGIVVPPAFLPQKPGDIWNHGYWEDVGRKAMSDYSFLAVTVGRDGKQARETARAVLPNCTETKIVVTGNLRAWMEFLEKRDSPHADAEIQRLAKVIRARLKEIAPHVFTD